MLELNDAAKGLRALLMASVIGIIGGIAVLFVMAGSLVSALPQLYNSSYLYSGQISASSILSSTGLREALILAARNTMLASLVVGVAVGLVQLYGWSSLRSYRREKYSTPYIGTLTYLVGVVAETISAYFLIGYLAPIINEIESGVTPSSGLSNVGFLVLIIMVAAILIIAGEIMILIGIWRAGSEFNSTWLKAYIALIILSVILDFVSTIVALIIGAISVISLIVGFYVAYKHANTLEPAQQSSGVP